MICPKCGTVVGIKRNSCDRCGEDLTTYKKLYILSNNYYNAGLQKAQVRDLTGAVLVLRKSLEFNKKNTDARNLLGLVYYEIGETVSALSEWVISRHFQPEDNEANDYINELQSNPTKLENLNQTIKKFNSALLSAKQGSGDLAILQLKKVVNLNPHFVKALQLLSLLYMQNGENDKALKYLVKANKIDVSNTTTLRYLHELGDSQVLVQEDANVRSNRAGIAPAKEYFPKTTYKEDKPNVWAWINLFLGVVIGVACLFFLIVPQVKNNYINQIANLKVEHNAELNKETQKFSSIETEKISLQEKINELQKDIESFVVVEYDETIYDELFEAAFLYNTELAKVPPEVIDYVTVADAISKVNLDELLRQQAIDLYNQIKDATYVNASDILYDNGHDLYSDRKYDEALEILLKAYEYDPTNVDAIYFIGRSYHQKTEYEKAVEFYNIVIEKYPDDKRAGEAQDRLATIPN